VKKRTINLGPTGAFPEGKLNETDEGELAFAVYHQKGKVILEFNSQVKWLGMNASQGIELGKALIKHSKKILKGAR